MLVWLKILYYKELDYVAVQEHLPSRGVQVKAPVHLLGDPLITIKIFT